MNKKVENYLKNKEKNIKNIIELQLNPNQSYKGVQETLIHSKNFTKLDIATQKELLSKETYNFFKIALAYKNEVFLDSVYLRLPNAEKFLNNNKTYKTLSTDKKEAIIDYGNQEKERLKRQYMADVYGECFLTPNLNFISGENQIITTLDEKYTTIKPQKIENISNMEL